MDLTFERSKVKQRMEDVEYDTATIGLYCRYCGKRVGYYEEDIMNGSTDEPRWFTNVCCTNILYL